MKLQSLEGKVVVITGASSGIGKLAVERFIEEGAKVVLAARSDEAMQEHLDTLGVGKEQAIVVHTDVSDYEQVKALARSAVEHFGRIDVWVNNAAVNLYGFVEDIEMADIRRVIDVNLMGQIHGMKVALDIFKNQKQGNIINVESVYAVSSAPLEAAYVASKHGILGFACSLREELMTPAYREMDIAVSDLLPGSMDTPFTRHAKSMTGKVPLPLPPIYDPMLTVQAILDRAKDPRPITVVSRAGKGLTFGTRMMPVLMERVMAAIGIPGQQSREQKPVEGNDNLYGPMPGTQTVRGGFGTTDEQVKDYLARHPFRAAAAVFLPILLPLLLAYPLIKKLRMA